MTTDPVRTVLDRLPGHRPAGDGQFEAKCPAHEDSRASLSVGVGQDGRALLKCHAGCETAEVLRAMELAPSDLFPPKQVERRIVATYDYRDEHGRPLFEVVRYEPKDFRQRHRGPKGDWVWRMDGVRRVPYRLPELRAACADGREVWVAEGEKDCDSLRAKGFVATCNPGGAGKWRPEFSDACKGASAAYVLPDNDAPGRAHADAVAAALVSVVPVVKVVALSSGAKDATEWFGRGGTANELLALAAEAPAYSTSTDAPLDGSVTPTVASRSLVDMVVPLSTELLRAVPAAREYLIYDVDGRGVMPRARVGMLGAPGGTGKSKAVVGLAAAVASGGKWFGAWQCERGRVLLILAEEDRAESLRRLHYALRSAGDAALEDVARNVTLVPAAGEGLALTYEMDAPTGALPETARANELRKLLREAVAEGRPYALVVLDPSSRFAGADVEKDNAAATRYVQVLETLTAADCGSPNVLLPAHTRKASKDHEPGSTDALRGSSGLRDGARWVAMLERRKLVDGAPKLLDLFISKTNYGPENALVLAAQEDQEGTLRAATGDEVEQYADATKKRSGGPSREDKATGLQERIAAQLAAEPQSGRTLAQRLGARRSDVDAVLASMSVAGRVRRAAKAWELVAPTGSRSQLFQSTGTGSAGSPLKGESRSQQGHWPGASANRSQSEDPPTAFEHPTGCRCAGDKCELGPATLLATTNGAPADA